jgi:hypothetical protein
MRKQSLVSLELGEDSKRVDIDLERLECRHTGLCKRLGPVMLNTVPEFVEWAKMDKRCGALRKEAGTAGPGL